MLAPAVYNVAATSSGRAKGSIFNSMSTHSLGYEQEQKAFHGNGLVTVRHICPAAIPPNCALCHVAWPIGRIACSCSNLCHPFCYVLVYEGQVARIDTLHTLLCCAHCAQIMQLASRCAPRRPTTAQPWTCSAMPPWTLTPTTEVGNVLQSKIRACTAHHVTSVQAVVHAQSTPQICM